MIALFGLVRARVWLSMDMVEFWTEGILASYQTITNSDRTDKRMLCNWSLWESRRYQQDWAPHRTFCMFSFPLSSQFHYSAEGYETSIRAPASLDYESCARCYLRMFMSVLLWLRQLHCWRSILGRAVVAADVVSAPLRRVHQMPQIFISSFLGLAFFVCDFILLLSNTI